jgi:hypothetical protein
VDKSILPTILIPRPPPYISAKILVGNMDNLKGGFMITKKEKLKQLKEEQRKFIESEEAARPDNPNYKKGRRSASEIFAGITRHNRKSLADY